MLNAKTEKGCMNQGLLGAALATLRLQLTGGRTDRSIATIVKPWIACGCLDSGVRPKFLLAVVR